METFLNVSVAGRSKLFSSDCNCILEEMFDSMLFRFAKNKPFRISWEHVLKYWCLLEDYLACQSIPLLKYKMYFQMWDVCWIFFKKFPVMGLGKLEGKWFKMITNLVNPEMLIFS